MKRTPRTVTLAFALLLAALSYSPGAELVPGNPAPDFELKDTTGKSLRLSSLRGEVVLLHFWATWCPYCEKEMPLLASAASAGREESSRRVRILAINLGEPARVVDRYLRSHPLDLPVLLDSRGKVAAAYGVLGLPTTLVVDASGRLAGEIFMGDLSRENLEETLKPLLRGENGAGSGN